MAPESVRTACFFHIEVYGFVVSADYGEMLRERAVQRVSLTDATLVVTRNYGRKNRAHAKNKNAMRGGQKLAAINAGLLRYTTPI